MTVSPYAFRCGCSPAAGIICSTHCQWQGCTDDMHTEACVKGERVSAHSDVIDKVRHKH